LNLKIWNLFQGQADPKRHHEKPEICEESSNSQFAKPDEVLPLIHSSSPKPDPAPLASEEDILEDNQTKFDSAKAVVIKKVGEKTPPGTLKKDKLKSSCQSW